MAEREPAQHTVKILNEQGKIQIQSAVKGQAFWKYGIRTENVFETFDKAKKTLSSQRRVLSGFDYGYRGISLLRIAGVFGLMGDDVLNNYQNGDRNFLTMLGLAGLNFIDIGLKILNKEEKIKTENKLIALTEAEEENRTELVRIYPL